MTSFIVSIAICLILILVEKQVTLTAIANLIIAADDFEEFVRSTLNVVYAMIVVTFGSWFFFGEASVYVSFYGLITAITMLRVDLDNVEENFDKLKNMR